MNFYLRYSVSSYPCFEVYTCTRLSSVKGIYMYTKYFRKHALLWIHIKKGVRFGYVQNLKCTYVQNLKCTCVHIGKTCPYGEYTFTFFCVPCTCILQSPLPCSYMIHNKGEACPYGNVR